VAAARSRLGEEAWTQAWQEGRAMTPEQAVEYALSGAEELPGVAVDRSSASQDPAPSLTRREREIAELVARGLTNRQVASELSISEHTAATHVRKILKKLGLRSRTQIGPCLEEHQPLS
jgi:non-specific serine/threonine protein kinase